MQNRRDDLQGIRSLAVVAVVFYHLRLLPGGFVGVDVFFVLSGFLITRLLMRGADADNGLNLLGFWAGRIKRLLPNAILTLLAVLIASAFLMPSYRRADIAGDVESSAIFLSNIRFAERAVDYLRLGDPPSPVLHFWSLSVEWQFYIVFPILLVGALYLFKAPTRLTTNILLIVVAGLSFAASYHVTLDNQPAAFFHSYSRAWQFAIGGLVGANISSRNGLPAPIVQVLCWAGFAAILYAIFRFDENLPYPGLYALAPTLGTAFLILGLDSGGSIRPLQAVFSLRPMLWLGDRSYSLYLWHWPVIIFSPIIAAPFFQDLLVVAITLVLATAAFEFVERPIHQSVISSRGRFSRPIAAGFLGTIAIFAAAPVLNVLPAPEMSAQRNAEVKRAAADLSSNYKDGCHLKYDQTAQPPCIYGRPDAKRTVVLFGDSHAAQWLPALSEAANAAGWKLHSWTKSGCPSAEVTIWYQPRKTVYEECQIWRTGVLAALKRSPPDLVVLANYSSPSGWLFDPSHLSVLEGADADRAWLTGLEQTIRQLNRSGTQVMLLRDTPVMFDSYRTCLAYADLDCSRPRSEALRKDSSHELVSSNPDIKWLDLSDLICEATDCSPLKKEKVIYRDQHHLTASFAASLWSVFLPALSQK